MPLKILQHRPQHIGNFTSGESKHSKAIAASGRSDTNLGWELEAQVCTANRKSRRCSRKPILAAYAFLHQALMSECGSQSHWVGHLFERIDVEDDQDEIKQ